MGTGTGHWASCRYSITMTRLSILVLALVALASAEPAYRRYSRPSYRPAAYRSYHSYSRPTYISNHGGRRGGVYGHSYNHPTVAYGRSHGYNYGGYGYGQQTYVQHRPSYIVSEPKTYGYVHHSYSEPEPEAYGYVERSYSKSQPRSYERVRKSYSKSQPQSYRTVQRSYSDSNQRYGDTPRTYEDAPQENENPPQRYGDNTGDNEERSTTSEAEPLTTVDIRDPGRSLDLSDSLLAEDNIPLRSDDIPVPTSEN